MKTLFFLTAIAHAASPTCSSSELLPNTNDGGADLLHIPLPSASACLSRCCLDPLCRAYTFTTSQPHPALPSCAAGAPCCWLKSTSAARTPRANCTSGAVARPSTPVLARVGTIAADPAGHLRDPSPVLVDGSGGFHFWVDFIPLSQGTEAGWHAVLRHYTAPALGGPWTSRGAPLNWSADPAAWDSGGMLSPSALFDAAEGLWWLFYTGTAANYTATLSSAQLAASAPSPFGPWTRRGLVCAPTGAPPAWGPSWNARRCDSGRALVVAGRRGYWTKGVRGEAFAQEGVLFPRSAASWAPPYAEWPGNPVYNASSNPGSAGGGYENCEFFTGPAGEAGGPWLHVLCQNHGAGQPHFVTRDALAWEFLGELDTAPALEPTPVYSSSVPGDAAGVTHFISRAEGGNLHIDLFSLSWV